jgi:hypothetical protein
MNDDTVCRVKEITASIATLIRLGLVRKLDVVGPDGLSTYLTTGAHPHVPTEVSPQAAPSAKPIDPYSLTGLRLRGYQVMEGETAADDRVMIDGGYYRITAARENGLI